MNKTEESVKEMLAKATVRKTTELCDNIITLIENIKSLMNDDELTVGLAHVGVVFSLSCCDRVKAVALMGHKDGIKLAFEGLEKDIKEYMEKVECQNVTDEEKAIKDQWLM